MNQITPNFAHKLEQYAQRLDQFIQMFQNQGVVPRCTDIEVIVNDQSGRYQLPDSDILRGKTIVGISCSVQEQISTADTVFTPLDRTVVTQTVINSSYLTLNADSLRFVENIPLRDLVVTTNDRRYTPLANVRGFNPTKSTIEVGNPTTPSNKLVVGSAFLLHFYYID